VGKITRVFTMKSSVFYACFILNALSISAKDADDQTECGGILQDIFDGIIIYKTNLANERCVWTIVNEFHYDGLSVELLSADLAGKDEYLELYALETERGGALRTAWDNGWAGRCKQAL